jgi:hypothetical protein
VNRPIGLALASDEDLFAEAARLREACRGAAEKSPLAFAPGDVLERFGESVTIIGGPEIGRDVAGARPEFLVRREDGGEGRMAFGYQPRPVIASGLDGTR